MEPNIDAEAGRLMQQPTSCSDFREEASYMWMMRVTVGLSLIATIGIEDFPNTWP
jgi:hypothetical protein